MPLQQPVRCEYETVSIMKNYIKWGVKYLNLFPTGFIGTFSILSLLFV